jgi:hypothetical protein
VQDTVGESVCRPCTNHSHSARSGNTPDSADNVIPKINLEGHRQSSLNGHANSPFSGKIGGLNFPDRFSDLVPFPVKSADIAEFSHEPGRHSEEFSDQTAIPATLPPITGDSKNVALQKWEFLSASERVAFLQRWLMYAEVKYKCPVDSWPEAFAAEWLIMKGSPSAVQCLIAAEHRLAAGKSVLNYIARVMEGKLPDDVEQWRVLYVQAYHIIGTVSRACTRLKCYLNAALVET